MRNIIVYSVLFICMIMRSECQAQEPVWIEGVVYEDKNGNGVRDSGERGISGIRVSNGDTILNSGKQGRFTMKIHKGESLFPILPENYNLSGSRIVNAGFYYCNPGQLSTKRQILFGLNKKKVNIKFMLNAIGDVQIGDQQELEYASRTLFPELLVADSSSINLFLGDQVNNNLAMLSDVKRTIEYLPMKSWTVIGNHDRNVDSVRINQERTYNEVFGSSIYAFNEGNVHFITINNVYGTGIRSYTGHISERQLRFVKNDLRRVSENKQLVICMHIPLAYTDNADALIQLLEGRGNVLVLTGHMHQVDRHIMNGMRVCIHELTVGASCGFWWVGEKDWEGIPTALMQCGTPRNYFVFNFTEKDYSFRFKGIGLDANKQMNIWVAGIDSTDVYVETLKNKRLGEVNATIYGASDSTIVRCKIDNNEWMVCEKQKELDSNVARLMAWNRLKVYPTKFSRRNPFRNSPSSQVWSIQLPEQYQRGTHVIVVEAFDKWGFKALGTRTFQYPSL